MVLTISGTRASGVEEHEANVIIPQIRVRTNEKPKERDRPVRGAGQHGLAGSSASVVETFPAVGPSRLLGLSFGVVEEGSDWSRTSR